MHANTKLASLVGLTPLLAAGTSHAQDFQIPEHVAPDPIPGATTILYPGSLVESAAVTSTSVDRYQFWAEAGDTYRIQVDGLTLNLDPRIRVFEPDGGGQVVDEACGANSFETCSVSTGEVTVVNAGFQTVLIDDLGADNGGSYHLGLQGIVDPLPVPGLTFGGSVRDSLQVGPDSDFFSFEAEAGGLYEVRVDGLSLDLDPGAIVRGPDGQTIDVNACAANSFQTCSLSLQFATSTGGTHWIEVYEAGADNAGSYEVSLTCILGGCQAVGYGVSVDPAAIGVGAGGTVEIAIDPGTAWAGQPYLLLASASGFRGGTPIADLRIPLNAWLPGTEPFEGGNGASVVDPLFTFTLTRENTEPYADTFGTLDGQGRATAVLTLPAGSDSSLAGLELFHAFVVLDVESLDPLAYVSNAAAVELTP